VGGVTSPALAFVEAALCRSEGRFRSAARRRAAVMEAWVELSRLYLGRIAELDRLAIAENEAVNDALDARRPPAPAAPIEAPRRRGLGGP
jgi:hypothetical protein